MSSGVPSYWSGVTAGSIPFEDVADYSRWACLLLERGHDSPAVCALAGMENEQNLFVLREWHRKALGEMGITPPEGDAAQAAHARGQMEEFLGGRITCVDLLQVLRDQYLEWTDASLEPFFELHCAWWDDGEADWGFANRDEIAARARGECERFIAKHQEEQAGLSRGG